MPKINGKIYYNNVTGDVLHVVHQNEGPWLRETSFEEDLKTYSTLQTVSPDVVSLKRLKWDEHRSDFTVSRPVKVENGVIQWQPFDEAPSEPPSPSMSAQIKAVTNENKELKATVEALQDVVLLLTMTR